MKIERREQVNIYRKRWENPSERRIRPATILKYVVLTFMGILLFRAGQAKALIERGYEAMGGEVFALFLPVLYWMVSRIVKDLLNAKKESGTWR